MQINYLACFLDRIWVSYEQLPTTVKTGDTILLDDGAIELKVVKTSSPDTLCEVVNTGVLGNKKGQYNIFPPAFVVQSFFLIKGVNLPGVVVQLPAMCEKDKVDIRSSIYPIVECIHFNYEQMGNSQ